MKNLKMLLVVFVLILSSAVKAESTGKFANPDSVSVEIDRMLKDFKLANAGEDLEVTVFFSVSEDQKIQNLSVASSNGEVGRYIQERLENKELAPEAWMKGKIYELTVLKRAV